METPPLHALSPFRLPLSPLLRSCARVSRPSLVWRCCCCAARARAGVRASSVSEGRCSRGAAPECTRARAHARTRRARSPVPEARRSCVRKLEWRESKGRCDCSEARAGFVAATVSSVPVSVSPAQKGFSPWPIAAPVAALAPNTAFTFLSRFAAAAHAVFGSGHHAARETAASHTEAVKVPLPFRDPL
eukprot:2380333-Pleurochrysis_carterae.AAC.2